jgi:acetyltransferase-like isoleucine patch superfamily enzyme
MKILIMEKIKKILLDVLGLEVNDFHPFVIITGKPTIGRNVYIGAFSEVNAKNTNVIIQNDCDIASFVAINAADSHKVCLGLVDKIERKRIWIGNNVFIGSHSVIKGGTSIGHHSVIAAGSVVGPGKIPPYSLVWGNPMNIRAGYYDKS